MVALLVCVAGGKRFKKTRLTTSSLEQAIICVARSQLPLSPHTYIHLEYTTNFFLLVQFVMEQPYRLQRP